jgi:hypothetical protein
MNITSSISKYFAGQRIIVHYATAMSAFLFIDLAVFTLNPKSYQLNDWMINSAGGFVRRSLGGDLFLFLERLSGVPVNILVFLVVAPILYIFCRSYFQLVISCYEKYWIRPVIFSSAGLLPYAVSDFGGHKEILIFALFAYVAGSLGENDSARFRKIAVSLFLLPVIAMMHEGLVAWFPFFFALLVTVRLSIGRLAIVILSAAIISLATIVSIIFRVPISGTYAACHAFREGLGVFGSEDVLCHAMNGLVLDAAEMNAKIITELTSHPFWIFVGVISFLAPIIYAILSTSPARYIATRNILFVSLCLISSAAMIVPLSLVAVDWGRFLSIFVIMFTTGFLALCSRGLLQFQPALGLLDRFSRSDWRYAVALAVLSCFPAKPIFAFHELAPLYLVSAGLVIAWVARGKFAAR